MPAACGNIWNSDGSEREAYTKVPYVCCDVNAGAKMLVDLTTEWPDVDNCYVLDLLGDMSIHGTWAGGCSDDGTFFYGEKCGGSNFGPFQDTAYGSCTQPDEYCSCIGTVETKEAGCYTVATPTVSEDPTVQTAVFLKVDGCIDGGDDGSDETERTMSDKLTENGVEDDILIASSVSGVSMATVAF